MDFQQKLRHTPNVEDEYGNTLAQRAELDWLLYNKPLDEFPEKTTPYANFTPNDV